MLIRVQGQILKACWFNTAGMESVLSLTDSCLGMQVSQDAVAAGYRSVPF